jgi:UDP-N-acetylmuramoyl-tripeptide--D-alanyl-D-alanine ligase
MKLLSPFFVQSVLHVSLYGKGDALIDQISYDSRTIVKGDTFVAITGQNHNGNIYIRDVLEKGASGLLIHESYIDFYIHECKEFHATTWCIGLADTKKSLLQLAKAWRELFTIPVIGITGTVGKTTTKEMLGVALSKAGHTPLVPLNSQNSMLGLALTLLKLRTFHTIAVCEVGINQKGEMDILADVLRPDIAIITHIGSGHLEGLKNIQTVASEKAKLAQFLDKSHGIVIFQNVQKDLLLEFFYHAHCVTYGSSDESNIQFSIVSIDNNMSQISVLIDNKFYLINLNSIHQGVINSAMIVASVFKVLSIDIGIIENVFLDFKNITGRFNVIQSSLYKGIIINDAYNANPESMKACIDAFASYVTSHNKIIVLGDMFELGDHSEKFHRDVLLYAMIYFNKIILYGNYFKKSCEDIYIKNNNNIILFDEKLFLGLYILEKIQESNIICIKGSRSLGLYLLDSYIFI